MSGILHDFEHIPPRILKKLLGDARWEGTPESGTMALTFDDGPDPDITPGVLDTLDEFGARGTFFLVGERVREHPDTARLIVERGHFVGNHSMTHQRMLLMKKKEAGEEIDLAGRIIADASGAIPLLFRPPYGVFSFACARAVRERGMKMILWTVLSGDYSGDTETAILKRVEPFIRAGSIIVFHDKASGGGQNLPGIIKRVARAAGERNIRLGGVDELTFTNELTISEEA
jgi:peptidoglycan-N-acetylglucosamine deacetylase